MTDGSPFPSEEAREYVREDLRWLADLGVLEEPLDDGALEELFEGARAVTAPVDDAAVQATSLVALALRERDRAFSFSYDMIHGYGNYRALADRYRRIADGYLDDLEVEIDYDEGDWVDHVDPDVTLALGDETVEPEIQGMGTSVDPAFHEATNEVVEAAGADRRFRRARPGSVTLVVFARAVPAAAVRVYFDDREVKLPPSAATDVDALLDHLADGEPEVCRAAAAVVRIGSFTRAIPTLEERVRDADPVVREACYDALASLERESDEATAAVRRLLGVDDDAVLALVMQDLVEARPRGHSVLDEDATSAREHVRATLDHEDERVRSLAADLIAEYDLATGSDSVAGAGSGAGPDAGAGSDGGTAGGAGPTADEIREKLEAGPPWEPGVLRLAGDQGTEAATPEIVTALEESDDQAVRLAAVEALGDLFTDRARERLVAALVDDDPAVREAAFDALAKITNDVEPVPVPDGVDGLPPILAEKFEGDEPVPFDAVSVVGHLDVPEAVDRLREATRADDEFVRQEAALWFDERPEAAAVGDLRRLALEVDDDVTVDAAIVGLAKVATPEAREAIREARARDGVEVPMRARHHLGKASGGLLYRVLSVVASPYVYSLGLLGLSYVLLAEPIRVLAGVCYHLLTLSPRKAVGRVARSIRSDAVRLSTSLLVWALLLWLGYRLVRATSVGLPLPS